MSFWTSARSLFGFGHSAALTNRYGKQTGVPSQALFSGVRVVDVDGALQIATVWRAVEILAKTIATMPMMVYQTNKQGLREEARDSQLWDLLHNRPNARQTPVEFWVAMLLNLILRGNAYAEIKRNSNGSAFALMVMPADQVQMDVRESGNDVYTYTNGSEKREISADNVLHIKEMTGGYVGMSRLEYMRISVSEAANAQESANGLFASNGRTTGILSPEQAMTPPQWDQLQTRVDELAKEQRQIQVLPGNLKLSQINLTPQDIELLTTRQFTVQDFGRWLGVPAILLNQTEGTTTLGSSAADIIESFYKLTIRPMVVNIEQALKMRVMTSRERATMTAEFNMDALLRASLKDRVEIGAKKVQNGLANRNEVRKLENDPPFDGGEVYTVQSNLIPMDMLGKVNAAGGAVSTDTVSQ
jgi:HK97 family phage portal protein